MIFPAWLRLLASASLLLGVVSAAIVIFDQIRRPQKMRVMNLVWPLTALFGSVIWLYFYFAWSRELPSGRDVNRPSEPFVIVIAKASSHCGAGCTLGDLIAEWAAYALPSVALLGGWHTVFASKMYAVWVLDFLVAFLLGIVIQYFTIKPMRNLNASEGLKAALKADFASITAWQVGMYGLMAAIQFGWFRLSYGAVASVNSVEFWFAMQLAMLAGFVTSYPVNWMLVRLGIKETM